MIRRLIHSDSHSILAVINNAAVTYKGVIPSDRWKEPYMSVKELKEELKDGVEFHGCLEDNVITGVIGIQAFKRITLISHSYVHRKDHKRGIGGRLL